MAYINSIDLDNTESKHLLTLKSFVLSSMSDRAPPLLIVAAWQSAEAFDQGRLVPCNKGFSHYTQTLYLKPKTSALSLS